MGKAAHAGIRRNIRPLFGSAAGGATLRSARAVAMLSARLLEARAVVADAAETLGSTWIRKRLMNSCG